MLTFFTGDPVWNDEDGVLEFVSEASCYVIPPFNTKSIKIELDFGDGKKPPMQVGLGSLFGFVGAFEHRFRNHTATVKIESDSANQSSVDSSIPFLYKIDLRRLKRLKDIGASASHELFTHKELSFIKNIREAAGEFSQLQDNTSLASVTEHGKVRVRMLATYDPSVT
jgi:hypothetical protein